MRTSLRKDLQVEPSGERASGLERIFAVLVLFYSTGAFWRLLQGERDDGVWMGALTTNLLWIGAYVVSFLLIRRRCAIPNGLWIASLPLLLPVVAAFTSLAWSDDQLLTFLRCGALLGTTVIGVYLGLRYSTKDILSLLACATGIAAVGSVICALWFPSFGIGTDEFEGLWIGAFTHKNQLGGVMAISFLTSFLLLWHERSHRVLWCFMAVLSLFIVLKADSMSSLAVCGALFYLVSVSNKTLTKSANLGIRLLSFGLPLALLLGGFALAYGAIVQSMGRDPELSGRGLLWMLVLGAIGDRPYLGYGYEAFWRGFEGTAGDIWKQMGYYGFYSHNGFLEVLLGMGAVGLISILVAFAFFTKGAFQALRQEEGLDAIWPWAFLLYLVASNLTEASLMRSNTLPWLLYTVIAINLGAKRAASTERRAFGFVAA